MLSRLAPSKPLSFLRHFSVKNECYNYLQHIRVLDLSAALAGPSCGQFLAELGADVIKIENISTKGDTTRTWRPQEEKESDISSFFSTANWGKRSVALNLKSSQGQRIAQDLAQSSDIVLASFKQGAAEKLGVDYDTLSKNHPRLIYGSVSGYGLGNPRAGYDGVVQGESGHQYLNGTIDSGPLKMPAPLMDLLASHQLREAILLQLLMLDRTGRGAHIDASLLASGICSLASQAAAYLQVGHVPHRMGSEHPDMAPFGVVFKDITGIELSLAIGTDKQFASLCEVLHLPLDRPTDPEEIEDFDFAAWETLQKLRHNNGRVTHREEMNALLQSAIGQWHRSELLAVLGSRSVPAGAMNDMAAVFKLPQARRLVFAESEHEEVGHKDIDLAISGLGAGRLLAAGVRHTGCEVRHMPHDEAEEQLVNKFSISRPPRFGEHTAEVLRGELGYDDDRLQQLEAEGVIFMLERETKDNKEDDEAEISLVKVVHHHNTDESDTSM